MTNEFSLITPSTAAMLITEMMHRHANELAATLATLRIIKSRGKMADDLLEQALIRVEAQAGLHRLLLDRPANGTMLKALQDLGRLLLRSRMGAEKLKILLDASDLAVPQPMRVPILLCAYELVNNAIKHHPVGDEPIEMAFERRGSMLTLTVSNRTLSQNGASADSMGLNIVQSISAAWEGETMLSGKNGRFRVRTTFLADTAPHLFRHIKGNKSSSDDGIPF